MHTGATKDVCGDADLSPRGVADALPLAVLSGRRDEGGLELGEVERFISDVAPSLQRLSLLQQMKALQRVRRRELFLNELQLFIDVARIWASAATRLIGLKRFEVSTYREAFCPAGGERRLVLVRHRSSFLHINHLTTMPDENISCNSVVGNSFVDALPCAERPLYTTEVVK